MVEYITDNWREVFPQAEHVIVGFYCSELIAAIECRPRSIDPWGLAAVTQGLTGDDDIEPIPLPPPQTLPEAFLRALAGQRVVDGGDAL
ncbi:hypothetical protein MASR1M32_16380 [Rhodobacter sp.]